MALGESIKEKRKQQGITQQELADRLYVSRQTISSWETGKSFPDIATLISLSNYFDLSLDTLIKGDVQFMTAIKNEGALYKLIQQGIFIGVFGIGTIVVSLWLFISIYTTKVTSLVDSPWLFLCLVIGSFWLIYFYVRDMYFTVQKKTFHVFQLLIHIVLFFAFIVPLFSFFLSLLLLFGVLSI